MLLVLLHVYIFVCMCVYACISVCEGVCVHVRACKRTCVCALVYQLPSADIYRLLTYNVTLISIKLLHLSSLFTSTIS